MTKARDIMSESVEHLSSNDTVAEAARKLAAADIGALPICDEEGHLQGMVTDRDLVVKVMAENKDPAATPLGEVADQGEVVTIGADDDIEEVIRTMTDHKVRRLPVIDGDRIVGIISLADVAMGAPPERVGQLVEAIAAAP